MSKKRKSKESEKDSNKSCKSECSEISVNEAAILITKTGKNEKLKEIIEQGKIVNINETFGSYPTESLLTVACERGNLDCVKLLVENNVDINNKDTLKDILRSLISSSNVEILTYLLEKGLVFDDYTLLDSKYFLRMDADNALFPILVELIRDVNCIHYHTSFLSRASEFGNVALVQHLLKRGVARDRVDEHDYDALRIAAQAGHAKVVSLLLNWNKTEAPIAANRVASALSTASYCGYLDVVRVFIEYGVYQAALTYALHEAIEGGEEEGGTTAEVVTCLLDAGVSVNAIYKGFSALTIACAYERSEVVKLLLTRGANPNLVDPRRQVPLEAAEHNYEILKELFEYGADPNMIKDGISAVLLDALDAGRLDDYIALFTLLLQRGADPNVADPDTGETPLMIAALAADVDLVELLLEYGADVTQVNSAGQSVLDMLGQARKYSKIVTLCESNKYGAKAIMK